MLPVFNGERFLPQQLDSLLDQTYQDWICVIRDDGSTDRSSAVIEAYSKSYPGKFLVVNDEYGNVGTVQCLNLIANHVKTPLFALCDQDDVWVREKLAIAVEAYSAHIDGSSHPLLIYSDLQVVDETLQVLRPSFLKALGVDARGAFDCLPVMNKIAGCSMLGNRQLLQLAFPVPRCAPMHDYWLGIVAKYSGNALPIEQALVLYRQHGANQLGAGKQSSVAVRLLRRLGDLREFARQAQRLRQQRIDMLTEFLVRANRAAGAKACELALAAEGSTRWRRLRFLLATGVNPNQAFVYWLA